MLVLSRQKDESIVFDGGIVVTVVDIRGDKVRLGCTAPEHVRIDRKEVSLARRAQLAAAAAGQTTPPPTE